MTDEEIEINNKDLEDVYVGDVVKLEDDFLDLRKGDLGLVIGREIVVSRGIYEHRKEHRKYVRLLVLFGADETHHFTHLIKPVSVSARKYLAEPMFSLDEIANASDMLKELTHDNI